jgi:1-acyl-sn-glycerol-3-phosphate acyltransferase
MATGVLLLERGEVGSGLRVMRAAREAFLAGLPILNFPEGTTTPGDRVLPLRRGLFDVARRAGAGVVPLALRYDSPDLAWVGDATFVPHFLGLAARPRSTVHLRFGARLEPASFANAALLARATRDGISALLEERAPWRRTRP